MCRPQACGRACELWSTFTLKPRPALLWLLSALLAASLAALQTRQPLSSLLVAAPGVSLPASPRIILSWCAPCGTPACCRTRAPMTVFVTTL